MKSLTKIQLMSLIQQRASTEIPMAVIEYWYMMHGHEEPTEEEEQKECIAKEDQLKD